LFEKKEAPMTLLISSVTALARRRPAIEAFVRSHYALRDRLLANPGEHERLVRIGLGAETRSAEPSHELIHTALSRVSLDARESAAGRHTRLEAAFAQSLRDAKATGLLRGDTQVGGLLEAIVADPGPQAK
jgi:hypothetical protein